MVIEAGISYSNIQQYSKLPCIFLGVLVNSNQDNVIPPFIEMSKEYTNNLEDVITLNPYRIYERYQNQIIETKKKEINTKIEKDARVSEIFSNYVIILNNLVSHANDNNLSIKTCFLRAPEDKKIKFSVEEASNRFTNFFQDINIEFKTADASCGILDIARNKCNYLYYKEKRKNVFFINNLLTSEFENTSQIVRFRYNNTRLEEYGGYFLGYPEIIYRNNHELNQWTLKPNQKIRFLNVGKYCVGPAEGPNKNPIGCVNQNIKYPFGNKLNSNWETCFDCKRKGSYYESSYLGSNRKKEETEFMKFYEYADHAIYITLFKDTVKIGRSLLNRVVSRLVEQTASDALVFYPITSLKTASYIEKKLADLLKAKINSNGISLGVDYLTKYDHVKSIFYERSYAPGNDYEAIYQIIQNKFEDPIVNTILNKEVMELSFINNWLIPKRMPEEVNKIEQFTCIDGKIKGIIGQFVFVDEEVYDFSKIQGMVGLLDYAKSGN